MTSDAAAVSWGLNREDIFYKGSANDLQHKWYSGTWGGPESLGGTLSGKPAVASMASGRLDVFMKGTDNKLYTKWYTSSGGWSTGFTLVGNSIMASDPAAVSWGNNRIDVYSYQHACIHATYGRCRTNTTQEEAPRSSQI